VIGPYVDAARKLPGTNRRELRRLLTSFDQ
jgi:hypothetical protein